MIFTEVSVIIVSVFPTHLECSMSAARRSSVALVTGASSGFGRLTAEALAKAGHIVYAAMNHTADRNAPTVAQMMEFAEINAVDLRVVELDAQSQESADAAARHAITGAGRIDILVHNTGHMAFGPAEAFTPEQYAHLYDMNVLSTQRVNRAVLPYFRRQRQGLLVWVSGCSTAGKSLFLAPYFAARAAMDELAIQYAREVSRWGIETSIVVPGVPGVPKNEASSSNGIDALASMAPPDADIAMVSDAIVRIVDTPFGQRPFQVHTDTARINSDSCFTVLDRMEVDMLCRVGLGDTTQRRASRSAVARYGCF
jgi:NAD(P)-dependent dehydrogenase (short-subunit alcohol dehydrogenase family)